MPRERISPPKKENDLELKFGDEVIVKKTLQGIRFKEHLESLDIPLPLSFKVSKIEGRTFFLWNEESKENIAIVLKKGESISMYLAVKRRANTKN